jgi:hypothetical protein
MSTYEGEHTIFGLLGQDNLTQNDKTFIFKAIICFLDLSLLFSLPLGSFIGYFMQTAKVSL